MEAKNLDELQIKDFEFYKGSGASYYPFLRKHNITTIAQLVDDNMEKLSSKCGSETKNELNILIAMAKHKYLNKPLPDSDLLDKRLFIDEGNRFYVEVEDKIKKRFLTENFIGTYTGRARRFEGDFLKEDIYDENTKLIDYLKWLSIRHLNGSIEGLVVSAYLEDHEKNKTKKTGDINSIEDLKQKLAAIIDMRNNLNNQINELQQQLEMMSQQDDNVKTIK